MWVIVEASRLIKGVKHVVHKWNSCYFLEYFWHITLIVRWLLSWKLSTIRGLALDRTADTNEKNSSFYSYKKTSYLCIDTKWSSTTSKISLCINTDLHGNVTQATNRSWLLGFTCHLHFLQQVPLHYFRNSQCMPQCVGWATQWAHCDNSAMK